MSNDSDGCGGCVGVGIAILVGFWVVSAIISGIAAGFNWYGESASTGGVVAGAFVGGLFGAAAGSGVAALMGNHREKANVGPLPWFNYANSASKLRKKHLGD